jgi:hypothetical protein
MARWRRGIAGACILCLLAGCSEAATQLVVVVDSDLPAPDRVSIRAVARPDDDPADIGAESTFAVSETPGPTTFVLPLSFGVVPPGGDAARGVEVVVEARDATDQVVVSRRARTGFVRGHTLRLPMFLAEACRGVECPTGQTCDGGVCVSDEVPADTLMEVQRGSEILDGGPRPDASAPSCAPFAATPVIPVPAAPVAAALQALPETSQWAMATDADPMTLFAVVGADGSLDVSPMLIATVGAWGLTMYPRDPPDRVDVAIWRAGESRVGLFNTGIDGSGSSPAILQVGQLDSRGVAARLGGDNVFALQDNSPVGEALVLGFEGGMPVLVGYPSSVDTWIASRADGGLLFAANDAGPACRVARVSGDRTSEAPVSVPIVGTSCARVSVAELDDGRVMMAYVADGSASYLVLDAALAPTGVAGAIGPAAAERIALWPGSDGSARAVFADGSGGITTARLEGDGAAPISTPVDTLGATVSPMTIRSSRMGDATGVAFHSPAAGQMMLAVLCEP